jgi:DnaK suppressor protein
MRKEVGEQGEKLTAAQKEQLKKVLAEEKVRLLHNAQEVLKFSMERERNIGRDSIDESMEEEIFSTELRLRDREKFLLKKITAALERLENNTVNECEDCGDPIGFRRLLARPVTTLCIDCKEEKEKDEQANKATVGRSTAEPEQMHDALDEE